ncbi:hypothetical protein AB6D11_19270 [Vibrio splendidus]
MMNFTKKCALVFVSLSASFYSFAQTSPAPTLVTLNVTLNNGETFSSKQTVLSLNQNTPTGTLRFPSGHIAIKDPTSGDAIVSKVSFEWQVEWVTADQFKGILTTSIYRKHDDENLQNTCDQPNASNSITMAWRQGYDPLISHPVVLKELDLELFNAELSISSNTAQTSL